MSTCSMARMHAVLTADFAGFRNGFAGCPCLPYSRMLAIFALLLPSERGSEKPILMSWLASRFSLTGDRPSDCTSSPVERETSLVPLPMAAARLLLTFAKATFPPASSTFSATLSVSLPRWDSFARKSSGSLKSTFANRRCLLFCQYLDIHSAPFYILNGNNVIATIFQDENIIGGDCHPRNASKPEQVGGFAEGSEVCPTLTAVPSLPIYTDGSEDFVLGMGKSLTVLDLFELYNVGKAVHFSETHTCHRLSNRSSRLTVFHTCCAAPVLSAKKPPVLPSRLS
nr:MAG TPA: hypothetical protein [Caudoviricetes sp.]